MLTCVWLSMNPLAGPYNLDPNTVLKAEFKGVTFRTYDSEPYCVGESCCSMHRTLRLTSAWYSVPCYQQPVGIPGCIVR